MNLNSEKNSLSDMVSFIADEIDIHRAIDDIDVATDNITKENVPENDVSHVYYVSATSDAQKEKEHIHKILERKNRSFVTNFEFDIPDDFTITMICLWDNYYKDDPECLAEFNHFVKLSQQHSSQKRIVIILLRPDNHISDNVPEGIVCLPGFDRVSRELSIFKIVQEESY
jgi:hypothetical protein